MIHAKSLRIDYEDLTAVHDLDIEIKPGQIYGLVGPNGAGKTSTIKALAGILEPTYGEIKLADIDLDLDPENALRKLGYMPDFPPVYENLKVWEYLDVFATAYLIERKERKNRVEHWLQKVDLTGKRDTFIRDLSRGMRQRLVLAKTLLHEPSVLLLDEPASGMDPIARMELRKMLKECADRGAAVLISSHILTELSDFCNAIGIMEKGRMIVSGTIDEIRTRIGSKGHLIVRLAMVEDKTRAKLQRVLSQSHLIHNLREELPGRFRGIFNGVDLEAAQLLNDLIANDLSIAEFHVEKENMEDIFLKVGAKEVS